MNTIKPYVSKQDIRRMLDISYYQAKKIFDLAFQIDEEELGKYRLFDTKTRITSVCKVLGLSLNALEKTKCTL